MTPPELRELFAFIGWATAGVGSGVGLLWAFYERVKTSIEKPWRERNTELQRRVTELQLELQLARVEVADCYKSRDAKHERMLKKVIDGMHRRRDDPHDP